MPTSWPKLLLIFVLFTTGRIGLSADTTRNLASLERSFWLHASLAPTAQKNYWGPAYPASPSPTERDIQNAAKLLTGTYAANRLYLVYHAEIPVDDAGQVFGWWRQHCPHTVTLVPADTCDSRRRWCCGRSCGRRTPPCRWSPGSLERRRRTTCPTFLNLGNAGAVEAAAGDGGLDGGGGGPNVSNGLALLNRRDGGSILEVLPLVGSDLLVDLCRASATAHTLGCLMGIDALDLTFRLEKRLGIKISRAEGIAVLFDTAGAIHRYLVSKLRGEYRQVPRIEPLFKEVADAVNRITGWWRLTSSLDLNRRFSPATRAANWQALEGALGMSLPQLEQPADDEFPTIPQECDSVITLTYWIVEHHPDRVEWFPVNCERKGKMATHQFSDNEVWAILCECICDALGVKPEEVTPDSRMIEDLGMN